MIHVLGSMLVILVGLTLAVYVILSLRPSRGSSRTTGTPPRFYVFLVPALNEEAVIRNTLDSLLALPAERSHVVVIDDASDDNTASIASEYPAQRVTVLTRRWPAARCGKGAALNFAYRQVVEWAEQDGIPSSEIVIGIVDADGRLQSNALEVMDSIFRDARVGAAQTLVRILNRHRLLPRFQDYEFVAFGSLAQAAREHLGSVGLGGNGQFTRLAALQTLGEDPWSDCLTEDLDLGLRLAIHGWRNRYTPQTWVEQQGLTSIPKLIRQRVRWSHGHFQCWKLIPALVRSDLPTVTVLDSTYYLLGPALSMIASAIFVVPFGFLVYEAAARPVGPSFLTEGVYLLVLYLFSFGPALLMSVWYWRRAKDVTLFKALLLGHGLALYNVIWYIAQWRAIGRILMRSKDWAKTSRLAEPEANTVRA